MLGFRNTVWRRSSSILLFDRLNSSNIGKLKTKVESPIEHKNEESQPLTDMYGRHHTYLRISLTERCNLRCQYCMPAEGVALSPSSQLLTTDEILHLANLFVKQGIRKIRLTGGEPTVRRDLPDIIRGLKSLEGLTEGVTMTTNGLMLTRQLVNLQRAGLDGLNISLDTFKPDKYEKMSRRKGLERVLAGIDLALQLGYNPVKVNCVIMRGFNDDEVTDFVAWTRDRSVDVRFIEYMPFGGNQWADSKLVPYEQLLTAITEKFPKLQRLQDGPNDTSKAYKVPGHLGQIGFITSMTNHFCSSCNRLRLTADGSLKVCLFGNTEVSLRDAMRGKCSEDDLVALIESAVKRKKKQHAVAVPVLPLTHQIQRSSHRMYSKLTHTDESGEARMVDIGGKLPSKRMARATAKVIVGDQIASLIAANSMKKGDVLSTARLAGIMAAKETSRLIPLCHNITLNQVQVEATVIGGVIQLSAEVVCDGRTGVEMEALTAVSVAALTVYDMCKAVSHNIRISDISLQEKTGGTRGDFHRNETSSADPEKIF